MPRGDRRPPRDETRFDRPEKVVSGAIIYGLLPVEEALRSAARRVERVFIADGARDHRFGAILDLARERSVPVARVPRADLTRMAPPDANTQGIVATCAAASYADYAALIESASDPALFVILDGVEDPRNFGAVLRTAECAGADGIFIPERRAVGLNETVAKSSAGAIEHIRVAKAANVVRLIEDLKRRGIWVIGTSGSAETEYTDWDWTQPSAVVLGAEGSGLRRLVAETCDQLVKISMCGKIESLNVSVAAGVLLFEATRQRRKG